VVLCLLFFGGAGSNKNHLRDSRVRDCVFVVVFGLVVGGVPRCFVGNPKERIAGPNQ
jgi:hypothetical protein